jgi:hypothetical protein
MLSRTPLTNSEMLIQTSTTTVGGACTFPSMQLEKCTNGRKSDLPDAAIDIDEVMARFSSMIKDLKDTRAQIAKDLLRRKTTTET